MSATAQPVPPRSHRLNSLSSRSSSPALPGSESAWSPTSSRQVGRLPHPDPGSTARRAGDPRSAERPPYAAATRRHARVAFGATRPPVLLTFFDSRCDSQCPLLGHDFGTMLRAWTGRPADAPDVSVNPRRRHPSKHPPAMASWKLAGPWRWHWIRGSGRELARVWRDYSITVRRRRNDIAHGLVAYLIDRRGFQRTGYLFPLLPNFVALDLQNA